MTLLARSFTDRATLTGRVLSGPLIAGERQLTEARSYEFRCRVILETTRHEGRGVRQRITARLLCPPDTELAATDRLHVESGSDGIRDTDWQVDGDPIPLLRRGRAVALQAVVYRIED